MALSEAATLSTQILGMGAMTRTTNSAINTSMVITPSTMPIARLKPEVVLLMPAPPIRRTVVCEAWRPSSTTP